MAKRYYSFMIDAELNDALKRLKERDGIAEGEQIRQALRDWFRRKEGVCPTCGRVRVGTKRTRSRKRTKE